MPIADVTTFDALRYGATEESIAVRNAGTATLLYPPGQGRIRSILQRECDLACVQAHVWHDLPLPRIPPSSWFKALETGRVGKRPAPSGEASLSTPGPAFPPDATEPTP
jgi:hypothetical protein